MPQGGQPMLARDSLWGRDDPNGEAAEDAGSGYGPAPNRAAAIQHAADAIQNVTGPDETVSDRAHDLPTAAGGTSPVLTPDGKNGDIF